MCEHLKIFPREAAIPFGEEAAATAAALYTQVRRGRGRELDLAVVAIVLICGSPLREPHWINDVTRSR